MLRRVAGVLLLACVSLLPAACDSAVYDADYAEPVGPTNGSVFDTESTIRLLWDPAPDAASYLVQVSRDMAFSEIVVSQRVGITTAEVGPLPKGTYYWRIVALALGRDEGAVSPVSDFIVEDQRILDFNTVYGFGFSGTDLTGLQAEFVSVDSSAIQEELVRLGIPDAEIRAAMPEHLFARLEEPQGATLKQIGALDFLLTNATGEKVKAAVLNTPPTSTYAPMTLVADSIVLGAEPRGVLQIAPAQNVPPDSFRVSIEMSARVLVVVP